MAPTEEISKDDSGTITYDDSGTITLGEPDEEPEWDETFRLYWRRRGRR
jgi:nitroreductase